MYLDRVNKKKFNMFMYSRHIASKQKSNVLSFNNSRSLLYGYADLCLSMVMLMLTCEGDILKYFSRDSNCQRLEMQIFFRRGYNCLNYSMAIFVYNVGIWLGNIGGNYVSFLYVHNHSIFVGFVIVFENDKIKTALIYFGFNP